jgi:hydrogenase maturation factor
MFEAFEVAGYLPCQLLVPLAMLLQLRVSSSRKKRFFRREVFARVGNQIAEKCACDVFRFALHHRAVQFVQSLKK